MASVVPAKKNPDAERATPGLCQKRGGGRGEHGYSRLSNTVSREVFQPLSAVSGKN
jgi:hypothetical protein